MYQSQVHTVDELKQSLVHVWHGIDQTIIDDAVDEWRGRLCVCVTVCGRRVDTLNKCCDNIKRLIIQPCDNTRFRVHSKLELKVSFVSVSYDLQSSFLL